VDTIVKVTEMATSTEKKKRGLVISEIRIDITYNPRRSTQKEKKATKRRSLGRELLTLFVFFLGSA
jgi:hypothetical protein